MDTRKKIADSENVINFHLDLWWKLTEIAKNYGIFLKYGKLHELAFDELFEP